jgi:hypothetical protein
MFLGLTGTPRKVEKVESIERQAHYESGFERIQPLSSGVVMYQIK